MKKVFQKVISLFKKADPLRKGKARKTRGQSMIEFAIALPILIMLFSGMIEFGFMLNAYLSLLDATRSAARLCSNLNPFKLDTATNTLVDDPTFAEYCAQAVVDNLAPPSDPNARQIVMDTSRDDVIVSVLGVSVDSTTNKIIMPISRFKNGSPFYALYGNQLSAYGDLDIESYMTQNGTLPVQTGMLIVEVYYGYTGILKLPWVEAFMSADNPATLYASTIMPLIAAKP